MALVITIIVLLILAGVTLSMVMGDSGIIAKAKKAKKEQIKADFLEEVNLIIAGEQVDKLGEATVGDILRKLDADPRYEFVVNTGAQYSSILEDGDIKHSTLEQQIENITDNTIISITRKDIRDAGYKIEVLIGKSASSTNGGIIAQIHEETEESAPKKESYTLSYDVNIDGLEVPETQQIEKDTETDVSFLPRPERNGYDFLGWSDNKEDLDGKFKVGSKITMNSNKTLYAIWGLQNQLPAGTIQLTESRADNDVKNYEYADTTSLYTQAQYNTHYNEGVQAGLNKTTGDAQPSDIKSGKTAWVNGIKITGTYTEPTLASQTPGTAKAEDIAQGKTAWVDGSPITGTMTSTGGSGGASGTGQIGDVLWTNTSPTVDFIAQTINLSEPITNYSHFIIEWYPLKSITSSYNSDLFEVGRSGGNYTPLYVISCTNSNNSNYYVRLFKMSTESQIQFLACRIFTSGNGGNGACIPYRIKGVNLTF